MFCDISVTHIPLFWKKPLAFDFLWDGCEFFFKEHNKHTRRAIALLPWFELCELGDY